MRKVFSVIIATALAGALLSCSGPRRSAEQPSTASAFVHEPAGQVVRAPLAPPGGYSSPSPLTNSPTPLVPYVDPPNDTDPQATGLGGWRASPRWAAIKGEGCIEVVEGEAGKLKAEECPKDDVGAGRRGESFGLPPE
jgi:hypothetical protein